MADVIVVIILVVIIGGAVAYLVEEKRCKVCGVSRGRKLFCRPQDKEEKT